MNCSYVGQGKRDMKFSVCPTRSTECSIQESVALEKQSEFKTAKALLQYSKSKQASQCIGTTALKTVSPSTFCLHRKAQKVSPLTVRECTGLGGMTLKQQIEERCWLVDCILGRQSAEDSCKHLGNMLPHPPPSFHLHHYSPNPQPLVVNPHDLVMATRITCLFTQPADH